jgi:hypothetical protein
VLLGLLAAVVLGVLVLLLLLLEQAAAMTADKASRPSKRLPLTIRVPALFKGPPQVC